MVAIKIKRFINCVFREKVFEFLIRFDLKMSINSFLIIASN